MNKISIIDDLDDFQWLFHHYIIDNNLKGLKNIISYTNTELRLLNKGFKNACYYGHIEIAKWLYSLDDKLNIHANYEEAFINACYNKHIEVAKWLMTLDDKPNVHAFNDYAFKFACYNRHIEVAKWLVTICDSYYIEIEDEKIKSWEIKNVLEDLYDKKEYNKIIDKLKIQRKEIIINKEDKCCICFIEDYNFLSSCNHCFCLDCFLMWKIKHNKKECCYCKQDIVVEKCIVKI